MFSSATVILDQYTERSRQPTVSEDTGYYQTLFHSPFNLRSNPPSMLILCQV